MGHQGQPAAARLPEGGNGRPGTPGKAAARRRPITASGAHAAPHNGGWPRGAPRPIALTNWPVAWRLFAVIVLAVLMGLVFGGLQVASAVSQAHRFAQTTKLARLGQQSIALAQALENERAQTAMDLSRNDGSGLTLPADLVQWYGSANGASQGITGSAADRFMTLAAGIDGSYPAATQTAISTAEQQVIDTLAATRSSAASTGSAAPAGAQLLPVGDYSLVIALLFQVNDVIGQNSPDTVLTTDVRSMGALSRAKDQASQQRAILWAALTSYALYPNLYDGPGGKPNAKALQAMGPAYQALSTSVTQEAGFLGSFQGSATPAQQNELQTTAFVQPNASMHTIVDYVIGKQDLDLGKLGYTDAAAHWNNLANLAISQLGAVESNLAQSIVDRSAADQRTAERTAWVTGLLTGGTLLLVLLAALLVARSVVLPLRRLRAGALDVASVALPERVRELGEKADPTESLEVAPINVMSSDEVGQVARAFDLVHQEAVRLAGNEAVLRASLNAMFVSLSRRSQSLIERLSRMIDALELNEDDPERLSNLFSMDHLVTRMRRNSENLLVLAGHEGARKRTEPVLLSDVVRAASSEIEQYGRVVLSVQSGIEVSGAAATDVVHLLAEIIENATLFSPRSTEVHVTGQEVVTGGVLIEVTDSGVGITEGRLEQLNWRLENPPVVDVSVSRHMGLFAVSHLAARHGVRVRLRPSTPRGLTAMVWLPESVAAATTTGYGDRYRRIAGRGYQQPLEPVAATARIPSQGEMRPVGAGQVGAGQVGAGQLNARQVGAGYAGAAEPGMTLSAARLPNGNERNGSPGQVTSNWFRPRRPSATPGRTSGGQARSSGQLPRQPDHGQPPGEQLPARQAGGWQARNGQQGDWQPFQQAPEPVLGGGTTTAGLPVRVPQANRLPNSGRPAYEAPAYEAREAYDAGAETAAATGPRTLGSPSPPGRSAETARTRLRGFQHGSRRAEGLVPREGEGSGR
jgi:signal transduction histidine kinase